MARVNEQLLESNNTVKQSFNVHLPRIYTHLVIMIMQMIIVCISVSKMYNTLISNIAKDNQETGYV